MKKLLTFTLLASSFILTTQAATTCTQAGNQRMIEAVYPDDGVTACEVQYTKGDSMTVLWSAKSDKDYCIEKAAGLVEKQKGWGWSCESDMSAVESEIDFNETTPAPDESDMIEEK